MQHFGSLNSVFSLSDRSILILQDERRLQEFTKVPGFAGFSNTARVTGLEISTESLQLWLEIEIELRNFLGIVWQVSVQTYGVMYVNL